jgi:hypothetical protein
MIFHQETLFVMGMVEEAAVTVEADRQVAQAAVPAEVLVAAVEEEAVVVVPREAGKWRLPRH